ncbi:MAG: response regulator [Bdellovibrionota bacterium]
MMLSASLRSKKEDSSPGALPLSDRLQLQNRVIFSIVKRKLGSKNDLIPICLEISEVSAKTIHAERSGIWLFSDAHDRARCIAAWNDSESSAPLGHVLYLREFPTFSKALQTERVIVANHCLADSRTQELSASYLIPNAITSVLAAPIWLDGELAGILMMEHVGPPRAWAYDEQSFVTSLADIVALLLDSCRRRETEERLAERVALLDRERAFFRRVIDMNPNFIFAKDRNGRYVLGNRALADAYGTTAEQLLGRTDAELRGLEFAEKSAEDLEVIRSCTQKLNVEEIFTDARGGVRVMQTVRLPMMDDEGTANHVLGVATDVSERKRAEIERERLLKQMQHAQQLESLGVLAGGIAHDFNNLLMAILGSASLIVEELSPRSPLRARVENIIGAGKRASELTSQLLAYSGRGQFFLQPLELSHVIEDMLPLLRSYVSKNICLEVQFGTRPAMSYLDSGQLRQVILHLVSNAADSLGEQPGSITLRTDLIQADRKLLSEMRLGEQLAEGQYVRLEVRDTGCGIPEDILERIFDPFFSTKFTGRGLGLAAVIGIVRSHRGALRVKSERGLGTAFELLFPLHEEKKTEERTGSDPLPESDKRHTVLVVDDEEIVRNISREMLMRLGYEVIEAGGGLEAAEIYRAQKSKISLVLLDLTMPGLDGIQTLKLLTEIGDDVPVLVTSGYSEQEVSSRFAGMHNLAGFIQKPFNSPALKAKLQAITSLRPLE